MFKSSEAEVLRIPRFDMAGIQTHDLLIIRYHFMPWRLLRAHNYHWVLLFLLIYSFCILVFFMNSWQILLLGRLEELNYCTIIAHVQSNLWKETTQETEQLWSLKTRVLFKQVDYSKKYTFGSLQGWSLNTGGLKNRLGCNSMFQFCSRPVKITMSLFPGELRKK